MTIRFKSYRQDGSEVIGVATDLGLRILGTRKLPWYITQFDIDGKTFQSKVLKRFVDGTPNPAAIRESEDVWTLSKHGFSHIELLDA